MAISTRPLIRDFSPECGSGGPVSLPRFKLGIYWTVNGYIKGTRNGYTIDRCP